MCGARWNISAQPDTDITTTLTLIEMFMPTDFHTGMVRGANSQYKQGQQVQFALAQLISTFLFGSA